MSKAPISDSYVSKATMDHLIYMSQKGINARKTFHNIVKELSQDEGYPTNEILAGIRHYLHEAPLHISGWSGRGNGSTANIWVQPTEDHKAEFKTLIHDYNQGILDAEHDFGIVLVGEEAAAVVLH